MDAPHAASSYYLSRREFIKGLANRFVFSSGYIILYLTLACLSLATIILSLLSDCPGLPFYVLEFLINVAMIGEVSIRLLAFGDKFWKSIFNIVDVLITLICVVTLLVLFFSGCSAKGEEVFDTVLLVARNFIQFGRLALVLRRSGKSVFTRVPAIDLSQATDYPYALDLDLDDEEAALDTRRAQGGDSEARGKLGSTQEGRMLLGHSDDEA